MTRKPIWRTPKGPVNIYGITGPGNEQRDHRLFLPFVRTGTPVILKLRTTGPPVISMLFFNGVRDYFQVLRYGAMDYFQLCKQYGTNNYFSIFSRILYGTKDYFPDFCTGPKIFLPFLRKFPRFLEPWFPIFKTGMTSYLRPLIGHRSLSVLCFKREIWYEKQNGASHGRVCAVAYLSQSPPSVCECYSSSQMNPVLFDDVTTPLSIFTIGYKLSPL